MKHKELKTKYGGRKMIDLSDVGISILLTFVLLLLFPVVLIMVILHGIYETTVTMLEDLIEYIKSIGDCWSKEE